MANEDSARPKAQSSDNVVFCCWIQHLERGNTQSCFPFEGTERKTAKGARRKPEERAGSRDCSSAPLQIKKRQQYRRHHEFSREEELEEERRRRAEREEQERRRKQEKEAPHDSQAIQSQDNSSEDEYHQAIEKGIREQFIGKEVRRRRTRHRRNGEPLMQWSNEDDTSEKDNPLYIKRAKVHLAFGRGYVVDDSRSCEDQAGVDVRQQRKDSEYMKSLLAIRSQAVETTGERDFQEQDKMVPISYNSEELNRQLIQDMQKNQQEKEEEVGNRCCFYGQYVQREGTGHGSHWSEKALEDMTLRDWHIMREDFEIRVQGARSIYPLRFWSEAAVHPAILKAVEILGYLLSHAFITRYKEPTPIQRQAIPIELKGMDMIGIAKTGSGKTCAFVVPMLEYVMQAPLDSRINSKEQGPLAVVMAPTRELAKQIRDDTVQLSQFCVDSRLASIRDPHIRVVCMVGGESIIEQSSFLSNGCDILIGTPGRLLDCLEQHYVVLNQTNYIVLDEADRMIDEGFEDSVNAVLDAMGSVLKSEEEEDIEKEAEGVVSLTNKYRTTIMFSATMPPKVEAIAKRYMRCPVQVTIGSSNSTTKIDIKQIINMVRESQKPAMLLKVQIRSRFHSRSFVIMRPLLSSSVTAKKQWMLSFEVCMIAVIEQWHFAEVSHRIVEKRPWKTSVEECMTSWWQPMSLLVVWTSRE